MPGATPRTVTMASDELGRVNQITWPDAVSETFAYDAVGNVTNHVDRAGRATRYEWLPTRKLASVTRTLTGTTNQDLAIHSEYDKQFNVLRIWDELNRVVEEYTLDDHDRPVSISNVDSQQMTITYGLGEYVSSVTRFDGTAVSFDYDSGGRLSQAGFPGTTNTFIYFSNDLLRTAVNAAGAADAPAIAGGARRRWETTCRRRPSMPSGGSVCWRGNTSSKPRKKWHEKGFSAMENTFRKGHHDEIASVNGYRT